MFKLLRNRLQTRQALRFFQQNFNPQKDYYKVLGVEKNASEDEIKRAYKKLTIKHHPDKGGSEVKFKEINEAKDVLLDNQKKKQYDESRKFSGSSGFGQGNSGYGQGYQQSYDNYYNQGPFGSHRSYGGSSPFEDMFREAMKQQRRHQQQQQQQAKQQRGGPRTGSKQTRYRDRYGNEYIVYEEYSNSHSSYNDPYSRRGGRNSQEADYERMFREFNEGFRNPDSFFNEIFGNQQREQQRENARREEEFQREQRARKEYTDNYYQREGNLAKDVEEMSKRVKDSYDIFKYSSEEKGFLKGVKDGLTYFFKGDSKKGK